MAVFVDRPEINEGIVEVDLLNQWPLADPDAWVFGIVKGQRLVISVGMSLIIRLGITTIKGARIENTTVIVEIFTGPLASTNTDWLCVVMVSDLIIGSQKVLYIERIFDFLILNIQWIWAALCNNRGDHDA